MKALLLLLTLTLAACASHAPVASHAEYSAPDLACFESTTFVNPISFFKDNEAHVFLEEVDGKPTSSDGHTCVAPGGHEIGAKAWHRRQYSFVRLTFEGEAKKTYDLKAHKLGITFHWRLYDLSEKPPKEVLAAKTDIAGSEGAPYMVPMPVPVKK